MTRVVMGFAWVLFLGTFAQAVETGPRTNTAVLNQGSFSYCTQYALATFLQHWGNAERRANEAEIPTLSAGFAAMSYNYEYCDGSRGTQVQWMIAALQRYGIIPVGASPVESTVAWPNSNWSSQHGRLIPIDTLQRIVPARYRHASHPQAFTGPQYLSERLRFSARDLRLVWSTHGETYPASDSSSEDTTQYRRDYATAEARGQSLATAEGTSTSHADIAASTLYTLAVAQLYQRKPVLFTIRSGLTSSQLQTYTTVGTPDLLENGSGRRGMHSIVGIGHCHRHQSTHPLCRRFTTQMTEKNIPECLVLQNSWGETSHDSGYVCVSRMASQRILAGALLLKTIVD